MAKQWSAQDVLSQVGNGQDHEHNGKAVTKDRQHTGRAFLLQLKYKAKPPEFIFWATGNYGGIVNVNDEHGQRERLAIFFAHRTVLIEGHYLELIPRDLETERTTIIQELDTAAAEVKMEANQHAQTIEQEAVVT